MKRRILTAIVTLCVLLALFPAGSVQAIPGAIKTEGNWTVGVEYTGTFRYTVIKYSGSSTTVTVPDKIAGYQINAISANAFSDSQVKHLILNENIRYISSLAACPSLETVTIHGTVSSYTSTFSYCPNLKKVEFKGRAHEFSGRMFRNCTSLEEIVLPEGLTNLPDECFSGCTALKRVTIPSSLTDISETAFDGCTAICEFIVKDGNPDYCTDEKGVLYEQSMGVKQALVRAPVTLSGHYDVADGITKLGEQAFAGCTALKSVTIPSSVTGISKKQFVNCTGLKTLNIGAMIPLKATAFTGVTADALFGSGEHYRIENGTVNTGWKQREGSWYYTPFEGCKATRITLPEKINPQYADYGISGVMDITLPGTGKVELCVPISHSQYATAISKVNGTDIKPLIGTWVDGEKLCVKLTENGRYAPVISTVNFSDVGYGFWAEKEIDYMTTRGLISGKLDGSFAPTEVITRKTVAMILWRAAGSPTVAVDTKLTDVNLSDRYTQPICWAEDVGIITGYADGTFRGDDTLTRQHFAVMLHRYAKYTGVSFTPENDTLVSEFPDSGSLYRWAAESMQWAVGNGLINGRSNGALDPQGNTTRAQLAVIMTRFLQKFNASI